MQRKKHRWNAYRFILNKLLNHEGRTEWDTHYTRKLGNVALTTRLEDLNGYLCVDRIILQLILGK
jgi:hypothetical protein